MMTNMGLPDLFQVTEVLRELVIGGVAQAADQPAVIPPAPLPAVPPDLKGLWEILANLGGWGVLLWSIVKSISNRVERFGSQLTAKIDRLTVQVKRLAREMNRIRHSPPPAAYSDGEHPVNPETK
jgi:hypothetical protein